jgi:DNA gyrase/topoisomerase IV subunit B
VFSDDKSVTFTGSELYDLLDALKDVQAGIERFEQKGIPRKFQKILLKKDEAFYRMSFLDADSAKQVRAWFEEIPGVRVRSQIGPSQDDNWIDVDMNGQKISLTKSIFDDPLIHKCFKAYPQVERLVEREKYVIVKRGKEIGRDVPWNKLVGELSKSADRTGVTLQRYKGLGEMNAEQLWETTMNPATRTLLEVGVEDAVKADQVFQMLMGDEVGPRKAYIQANARSVKNLDV